MKKNVMMRLASFLLVAVLISTSAISGTYAKYVTAETGSETARVAKWGVEITADSFGMFETDYETDDTSASFTGNYSVSSAGTDNRDDVMAPGTSGSFADIAITGTPEVAVDVAIVPAVSLGGDWTVDGAFYCPIVITVGGTDFYGLDYTSAADFAEAIADEIEGKSEQYPPNTDLSALYNNTNLDLAWAWAFEGSDGKQTDEKDTKLGNLAVAENLTIDITVAITVTQID